MELDAEPTNGAAVAYEQSPSTGGKELDCTSLRFGRDYDLLTISWFRFYSALRSCCTLSTPLQRFVQWSSSWIAPGQWGPTSQSVHFIHFNVVNFQPRLDNLSAARSTCHIVLIHPYDF